MAAGYKTGGRKTGTPNKATAEVKEIARQYTIEAIEALVAILRGDNAPAKVAAAREILDRGYGKAPQAIDLSATDGTLAEAASYAWQSPQPSPR